MMLLADLCETILTDDRVDGVLQTRTHGLLGLPISFDGGSAKAIEVLRGKTNQPGEWWRMHEESELVKLLAWGIIMGIGLAQRVALPRAPGQLQRYRLEVWSPRWLRYRYYPGTGSRWVVLTQQGEQPVVAGDGEWIVFQPYGQTRPWSSGKWNALAFPWLLKRYSLEDRANHSQVLGSPLWVGKTGPGSTQKQRDKYLAQLRSIGKNGKLVLPDGWDMQLRESTGNTSIIYENQITWADKAITVILAGQLVTTEGTSGFSSGNVHDQIKDDLLRFDAARFESCLREQSLIPWARHNFGKAAAAPWPKWNTDRPADQAAEATTMKALGDAIATLDKALSPHGVRVDVAALVQKFNIPTEAVAADKVSVSIPLAPTDVAKTVKVNEVRSSSGLGDLLKNGAPDPRGEMLISELAAIAPVQATPGAAVADGGTPP